MKIIIKHSDTHIAVIHGEYIEGIHMTWDFSIHIYESRHNAWDCPFTPMNPLEYNSEEVVTRVARAMCKAVEDETSITIDIPAFKEDAWAALENLEAHVG